MSLFWRKEREQSNERISQKWTKGLVYGQSGFRKCVDGVTVHAAKDKAREFLLPDAGRLKGRKRLRAL